VCYSDLLDRLEPQERRIAMRELRESDWFL
jgi:hypothetical protein